MSTYSFNHAESWPLWRKLTFRFLFVYLFFTVAPWSWFDLPDPRFISKLIYYDIQIPVVDFFNRIFFHIRPVLFWQIDNGSGDSSSGWATMWTYLLLSLVGCFIWTVIDRRRKNYNELNYWLCLFVRYFIAWAGLFYGFSKVLFVQMPAPSLHQLAVPLGDFSPMRFAWLFIGYAGPYQFFSGLMELVVGFLLLYRPTVTLGLVIGAAVFTNVMMLNLTYDIVVKIYSMHIVFCCLFLLVSENNRLFNLLVLNKNIGPTTLYEFNYPQKWVRITRYVLKAIFMLWGIGYFIYFNWGYYQANKQLRATNNPIFKNGFYKVTSFNYGQKDSRQNFADSLRWQDVIFDMQQGSISTADTAFTRRRNRAYFSFKIDSIKHTIAFQKPTPDGALKTIAHFKYTLPDTATIALSGIKGKDSLFVNIKRINRNFKLTKWKFDWLLDGPQ